MAFNRLLGKFSFVFWDEVLELSLDEIGKSNVIDLLKSEGFDKTIFVISHDENIRDNFENVINIRLENGESKIND